MVSLGPRKMDPQTSDSPMFSAFMWLHSNTSSARHHSTRIVAGQPWPPPLRSAPLAWWGCHHPTCGSEHPQKRRLPNNKQSLTTPFLWVEFKTSPNGRLIIRWSTLQYILDHPEFVSLFKTIQHIKHVMCSTRNGIVYTKDERNQVLDFLAMFMCCCWFRSYSWSPLMSHH